MNLTKAQAGQEYIVTNVNTTDEAIVNFLSSLGCYIDSKVSLISATGGNYIVTIEDARYSIGKELAEVIEVK